MKKHKICKILLVILAIFLCVAFYELLGICVAYKKQPEVSNTTKKETKNGSWNECSENTERAVIIEKNPEALLQSVRLIKNAKNRVKIHTPYIICNDMMYNTYHVEPIELTEKRQRKIFLVQHLLGWARYLF